MDTGAALPPHSGAGAPPPPLIRRHKLPEEEAAAAPVVVAAPASSRRHLHSGGTQQLSTPKVKRDPLPGCWLRQLRGAAVLTEILTSVKPVLCGQYPVPANMCSRRPDLPSIWLRETAESKQPQQRLTDRRVCRSLARSLAAVAGRALGLRGWRLHTTGGHTGGRIPGL
eukprot:COSAG01_NODE_10501_length_2150_cov_40.916626_2_plen_169_part_00